MMKIRQKEKLAQIRASLQYGDRRIIARVVDCSPELVKKVLSGEREHQKGKGKRVVEVAESIIQTRRVLEELRDQL